MSGKLEDVFIENRASKSGDFVEFVPLMSISPFKSIWLTMEESTELLGHLSFGSKGSKLRWSATPEGSKK